MMFLLQKKRSAEAKFGEKQNTKKKPTKTPEPPTSKMNAKCVN